MKAHVINSSNLNLRNAINLYVIENFVFSVVEFFEPHPELSPEKKKAGA